MTFLGIISEDKSFERIKEKLKKQSDMQLEIIHINKKSISNIKNIKFEILVIDSDLKDFEREKQIITKLCEKAKAILINTDINQKTNFNEEKYITYGLNQKATVTISSITDTDLLVCLQENIKDMKENIIEIEERHFAINENCKLKIYEIMIIYIIFLIKNKNIMEEM